MMSFSKCRLLQAMAASRTAVRSSAMPIAGFARGGEDVGVRGGMLARFVSTASRDLGELGRLDLVGLGQDEVIADRGARRASS